jgi:hypothetical protein
VSVAPVAGVLFAAGVVLGRAAVGVCAGAADVSPALLAEGAGVGCVGVVRRGRVAPDCAKEDAAALKTIIEKIITTVM